MKIHRVFSAFIGATLGLTAAPIASAVTELFINSNNTTIYEIPTLNGSAFVTANFTPFFTGPSEGSGVLDPFLSLQASPTEQGFNVDAGNLDTKRNGQFTRTQRVSDFITVSLGGQEYLSFVIDINEPNNEDSIVSLDMLKLYTSPDSGGEITSLTTLQNPLNATLRFDLDDIMDVIIHYDDANSGSGQGDLAFLIPLSAFVGVSDTDFFYMYQQWGNADPSNSGFEETRFQAVIIPETNALVPLLAVLGVVLAGPFVRRCFHP